MTFSIKSVFKFIFYKKSDFQIDETYQNLIYFIPETLHRVTVMYKISENFRTEILVIF